MKVKRKEGYYSISAVAKMFSVHQQTVRLYEKQGLISPKRSEGNTRLFSEEDIDRLEEVIYLTHELGINLAGVEMILKLKKQIKKLQSHINKAFEDTQENLDKQVETSKQLVKSSGQRLLTIKQQAEKKSVDQSKVPDDATTIDMSNWEIEYDDD